MNTPPIGALNQGPPFMQDMQDQLPPQMPIMPAEFSRNLPLSDIEEQEIISKAMQFKRGSQAQAQTKKRIMRKCYANVTNQFEDGDLLPLPASQANERDVQANRSKIFVPVSREQFKQLYSQTKLTFFANDEDWFRVIGKTEEAAQYEDDLTDALKYIFKRNQISEKLGMCLQNVIWAGNAVAYPCIKESIQWDWEVDPMTGEYVAKLGDPIRELDVEAWNPIDFYVDAFEANPERSRWGFYGSKKKQEILDSKQYYNQDKLKDLGSSNTNQNKNNQNYGGDLNQFNGLQFTTEDPEKSLKFDLFFFPHLKTTTREYRNMIIAIAEEQVLVEFHPNTYPKGLNPAVFFNWTPNVDSAYGTGPIEDIMGYQKGINVKYNYMVDVLRRIGNRYWATADVDLSNFFGATASVAIVERPGDIGAFTGDYVEVEQLQNSIGVDKAEAQQMAGAQTPFQGSSNIDFKKTATEIQVNENNSISVNREINEHLDAMGIQRVLDRLMYLAAELYEEPIQTRLDQPDPQTGQKFKQTSLAMLASGDFIIELTNINAAQSKQAQVASLMQMLQFYSSTDPTVLGILEPITRELAKLQGFQNINAILDQVGERFQMVQQQQQQQMMAQQQMQQQAALRQNGQQPI